MSPLFLLVIEGLSRSLVHARRRRSTQGIKVGSSEILTHLLFVNDVLLFCLGSASELSVFIDLILLYKKVIGMEFNEAKSTLYNYGLDKDLEADLDSFFPFCSLYFNSDESSL